MSPTAFGLTALLLWSLAAPIMYFLREVPTFLIMTVCQSISFALSVTWVSYHNEWSVLRQPLSVWLRGVMGLFGTMCFYVMAFKYAPPEKVDMINYLWPVMVLFLSRVFLGHVLQWSMLLALFLAFSGIAILFNGSSFSLEWEYAWGYGLAFLAALSWSIYLVDASRDNTRPTVLLGFYYGIGAVISYFLHCQLEVSSISTITLTEWALMIFSGLGSSGLAYFLWNYAIKTGDLQKLSLYSYFTPVMSIGFLVIFGMAPFTTQLAMACILVTLGTVVANYEELPDEWINSLPVVSR